MLIAIQDKGLRNYQEDRYTFQYNFFKNFNYFAVFDGHGDDKVSNFLKYNFMNIIKEQLEKYYPSTSIEQCLYNSFIKIHETIPYEIGKNSGSTALISIQNNNIFYIANIGDSRAIINDGNFSKQITIDHKPNVSNEYLRIRKLGGNVTKDNNGVWRINNRLALSRAFGDFTSLPYISYIPDIFKIKINNNNNYLIMASDGLWDVCDNQEIINIINNSYVKNDQQISIICKKLLQVSRSKGSTDNITILFIVL